VSPLGNVLISESYVASTQEQCDTQYQHVMSRVLQV